MPPPGTTAVCHRLARGLAACACLAAAACGSGGAAGGAAAPGERPSEAAEGQPAASSHTDADVDFMRGMIHHHAQAVVMARMVPDRAASPALDRLAARILNSQGTEISLMADWLRDRDEPVPGQAAPAVRAAGAERGRDAAASELVPPGGWDAGPQMPGLLSDAQMARLEAAEGEDFDRLFLTYMIEHHRGAVAMVDELVRSPGAAREASVFRLASGIRADQSTEIDRMRTMLREQMFGPGSPR